MDRRFLPRLYRQTQVRSLTLKLLLPLLGLMFVSLLGSAIAFLIGTTATRNQLLRQQMDGEAHQVVSALNARLEDVKTAADLLAHDPNVYGMVSFDDENILKELNARTVLVRNRFNLDLIQVYNDEGIARANLMLSSLYRESLMLDRMVVDGLLVQVVGQRVLLLDRVDMPGGVGVVIVGIDLETELQRLVSQHRLPSDLGVMFDGVWVGTREGLPFDSSGRLRDDEYSRQLTLMLGESPIQLLLVRPTTEIAWIARTGLWVTVASSMLTTLLLTALSVVITRSIVQPIRRLSMAAELVGQGDMSRRVDISRLVSFLGIGSDDEIALLAEAFNDMVAELDDLYKNLEGKVDARTLELTTAARIADAVSSSLSVDDILSQSIGLIQDMLGFFHVGIFLFEQGSDMIVLHQMRCQKREFLKPGEFRVPLGSNSPVGVAAATREPYVVQDVNAEQTYLDFPLLLNVFSEAAIPLLVEGTLIGVLDVQSEQLNAFTPSLMELLMAVADQIAIGVHNAQLYAQQRQTAEHLTEVDQLKTQFLAVMSHELRTPLNSIIGFSKILLNGLDGPLTDRQVQDIRVIHEAGRHLLSLIEDILDISSINAGKVMLDIAAVNLEELIQGVLDAVTILAKDKPIVFRQVVDSSLPTIYVDQRRVRQVLINLLSNAIKFTDEGEIVVRARSVIGLNVKAERVECVEVSVSDTGVGIPGDKLSDIFGSFTQADNSGNRRFNGAGLGLSIAKQLIELHGGRIWVKTKVEQGTTFTFTLPLNRPSNEQILALEQVKIGGVSLCSVN